MDGSRNTVVVKIGGTEGVDHAAICADLSSLIQEGKRFILVHGGSAEANHLGESLGCPPKFITSPSGHSSRYTDERTREIFTMAVNGKMNSFLVSDLQAAGINAIGLAGMDGQLILATRKESILSVENGKRKVIRDDFSGKIETVNTRLLNLLLEQGYTPVIAPLAISSKGEILNVDADRAAAMIAASLGSSTLILLTAAPGLMRNFPDEASLIHKLDHADLDQAMDYAQGRMKKKILGAKEALDGLSLDGEQRACQTVIIADGRIASPISLALQNQGTLITRNSG
jgi:acetylglutamate/LysW-gamma-L-alpha-aminoadipate kinase